jgi:DNA-binding LacI/PurR family transcriptional regulator
MAVTQFDVAQRAGVARKTVSNVISGYPYIRPEVRARVLAAIDELGYQPNRAAQNLRTGRSGVIGLALPELDVSYFAEMTRLVVEATERRGLTVLIIQTFGDLRRELAAMDGFGRQLIDGLICSPIASTGADLRTAPGGVPMVLLGEQVSSGHNHVGIDNIAAARLATEHLLSLGRRRIGFIGATDPVSSHMADLRLSGYREALQGAGVEIDPALVHAVTGYHRVDGAKAVERMLAAGPPPDALFCVNDLIAQGAVRALHDAGTRVPDDVAVVGFDDIDESRYSIPSLTTISPDRRQIAETAVALLASLIDGGPGVDQDTLVGFTLEVRESTVGKPAARAARAKGGSPRPRVARR